MRRPETGVEADIFWLVAHLGWGAGVDDVACDICIYDSCIGDDYSLSRRMCGLFTQAVIEIWVKSMNQLWTGMKPCTFFDIALGFRSCTMNSQGA